MDKQTDADIEALEENMGLKNLRIYKFYHNVQVFNYLVKSQCNVQVLLARKSWLLGFFLVKL